MKYGQVDLICVMILIATVLIIGASFTALVVFNISDFTARSQLSQLLSVEQTNLVIYRELENSTHVCVGLLRITPEYRKYALILVSSDLSQDLLYNSVYVISIPVSNSVLASRLVESSRVHYFYQGNYYPLRVTGPQEGYVTLVELPSDVIENYISQGRPALICINKNEISYTTSGKLIIFVYVSRDLYEVGEWFVSS